MIEVARLEELEQRTPTVVRAGARELVLVRDGERVHALRNACPHMDESFAGAAVIARIGGTPDEPRFDDDEPLIVCPWHRYEFSLADGRCLGGGRYRVRTYAVRVDDGRVLVDLRSH
jgi:nitrite reductase/ring-hydroxylating ferredoxin subunit